jgi:hypothetical protein
MHASRKKLKKALQLASVKPRVSPGAPSALLHPRDSCTAYETDAEILLGIRDPGMDS